MIYLPTKSISASAILKSYDIYKPNSSFTEVKNSLDFY